MGLYADLKGNLLNEEEYISLKTNYSNRIFEQKNTLDGLCNEKEKLKNQKDFTKLLALAELNDLPFEAS